MTRIRREILIKLNKAYGRKVKFNLDYFESNDRKEELRALPCQLTRSNSVKLTLPIDVSLVAIHLSKD